MLIVVDLLTAIEIDEPMAFFLASEATGIACNVDEPRCFGSLAGVFIGEQEPGM
jgi:hypothetical protein